MAFNEDMIGRAFMKRFLNNFSGAANAVFADRNDFDPVASSEFFQFNLRTYARKLRRKTDRKRIDLRGEFRITCKRDVANIYKAADYAHELRGLFDSTCFDVFDFDSATPSTSVARVELYEARTVDITDAVESSLPGQGVVYQVEFRGVAHEA